MHQIVDADVHIRWMVRRDLPSVVAIEQGSFSQPWTEDDFLRTLRCRTSIGMVAERGEQVVGYMLFDLRPRFLELLSLAVDPSLRRQGIGRQLIERLKRKMTAHRRCRIAATVLESHTIAHYWFKAMEFEAVGVLQSPFEGMDQDAFRFLYMT